MIGNSVAPYWKRMKPSIHAGFAGVLSLIKRKNRYSICRTMSAWVLIVRWTQPLSPQALSPLSREREQPSPGHG
jgi:hypothetical protein